jgi:hypothetical protein
MELTTGLIVVIVAMFLFYIRIGILRGQKKRYAREFALKRRKINGRSKGSALPSPEPGSPPYQVTSWWLVALAFIIMIAGMVVYNKFFVFGIELVKDPAFIAKYSEFWYIPVALGVLVLAFCFKIQKPILDE